MALTLFLVAAYLASGLRRVQPDREIAWVDGLFLGSRPHRVSGSVALAPPGPWRLGRLPVGPFDLDLPPAERARIRGRDGALYGLAGKISLQVVPEDWQAAARASRDGGATAALAEAVHAASRSLRSAPDKATSPERLAVEIRSDLSRELAERGFALRGLRIDALAVATVLGGGEATASKVLVIGLDGADWSILDPLIAQGRLPNLGRLQREGVRSRLLTISPALSPVVWTSVATGVEPRRHGILDFLVPDPSTKQGQPVTSAQRRVPAIWNLLSDANVPVGVTGWWATWPAEEVRGYLVSDRVAYQLFGYRPDVARGEGKTWPPSLYEELRELVEPPDRVPWSRVEPFLSGPRRRPEDFDADERRLVDDLRTLLASGETYLRLALAARSRMPVRFETVYFEGTDTVGHLFMAYRPPRLAGVDPRRFGSFRDVVDRYYELVDRYVGQLLEGREAGWTIIVLSDHGFANDEGRPLTTDSRIGHGPAADWHRRFGVLIMAGEAIRKGERLNEAGIYDVAPTILALYGLPVPRSWPGRVLAEALDPGWLESHPVRYRADDPQPKRDASLPVADAGTDAEAAELREKLRSLGYIGSAEPSDRTSSVTTHNNLGIALLAQGKPAEAEKSFREGLALQPDQPVLLMNLGTALRAQNRRAEAKQVFEQAFRFRVGRRGAGHQLAQLSLEEGDLERAEATLRKVLRDEPGAAEVMNSLGIVLERKGDLAGARSAYLRASELDADLAEPRTNLGNLARREGRIQEAEDWYGRAIAADPFFLGAYNNLAMLFQDRGELKRAMELYASALQRAPGNAVVLNNLGSLHYAAGEMERARELWTQAAEADPSYPSPLNNLAGLDIRGDRLDAAETRLRDALRIDPRYADAQLNLALVLRRRGDRSGARSLLEEAARSESGRAVALQQLGLLDLEAGDPQSAVGRLETSRALRPRDGDTLAALGEALRQVGRTREAVEVWQACVVLDPSREEVREALERLRSER